MFVSVDGKAREVNEIFAGGSDGLAHKVDEVFGSVDGVAKLVYTSKKREPNGFDQFTWAEIKELADNGLLLNYFKRYDMVDIKLKEPLPIYTWDWKDTGYTQNSMPMVISEICETGMRLVSHIAVPKKYIAKIDNELFFNSLPTDRTYYVGTTYMWGMCSSLYDRCKSIDNLLPDDMREVLHDFSPLYKYEYYIDAEGKRRLLQEYDDCRVRQITSNGYSFHKEYVEENERDEYILDTTYFARTESGYKKFFPEEARGSQYDKAYGFQSFFYHKDTINNWPYTSYRLMWQNPEVGWIWDWEDYWDTNGLGYMKTPIYTTANPTTSNVVPEVQIGVIEETLDKL
jgi:hypothetical protein